MAGTDPHPVVASLSSSRPPRRKKKDHPKSVSFAPTPNAEEQRSMSPAANEMFEQHEEKNKSCAPSSSERPESRRISGNPEWQWLYGGGGNEEALFTINVSDTLGEEYRPLFFDIARMICLHATIQFMSYVGGQTQRFFSPEFVEILLYIIIGTMLFWLVIRKIVWLA